LSLEQVNVSLALVTEKLTTRTANMIASNSRAYLFLATLFPTPFSNTYAGILFIIILKITSIRQVEKKTIYGVNLDLSRGYRVTSRIFFFPVKIMVNLSNPIAQPA
jgi:hypothetical protein